MYVLNFIFFYLLLWNVSYLTTTKTLLWFLPAQGSGIFQLNLHLVLKLK